MSRLGAYCGIQLLASLNKEAFYVYVLCSESTGAIYTGQSNDLPRRLAEHDAGMSRSTKGRGPWVVIYSEGFGARSDAMKRERFLKTGAGRDWLRRFIVESSSDP